MYNKFGNKHRTKPSRRMDWGNFNRKINSPNKLSPCIPCVSNLYTKLEKAKACALLVSSGVWLKPYLLTYQTTSPAQPLMHTHTPRSSAPIYAQKSWKLAHKAKLNVAYDFHLYKLLSLATPRTNATVQGR